MDPSIISAAVSGGSNLIDVGLNAALQAGANKQAKRYATYMYDRQRADALADWNMQNAYNSPSAQMDRLKAAHLNPKLVYGTGVQASGLSGPVRSSSASSYKPEAPQVSLGSVMSSFVDTRMKQQQMDVMKSVIDLNKQRGLQIAADSAMKAVNAGFLKSKTVGQDVANALANSVFQYNVEAADLRNRKTMAEVTLDYSKLGLTEAQRILTEDENGRRERLTKANIAAKLSTMALQSVQADLAKMTSQEREAQIQLIQQNIQNALKTREGQSIKNQLLQSELDYQTVERVQSWFKTILGGAGKIK